MFQFGFIMFYEMIMDNDVYILMFFTFLIYAYDMDGSIICISMSWMMIYMMNDDILCM